MYLIYHEHLLSLKGYLSHVCILFQITYALAWGNLNLFDFNSRFLSGQMSLHLWPTPHACDELMYPIGVNGKILIHQKCCLSLSQA